MKGRGLRAVADPKSRPGKPVWILLALLLAAPAGALDFPVLKPSREMFRRHRERFLAQMAPNSVAFLQAAPEHQFSNDVNYRYHQDSTFYYLTGLEEPGAIAVLQSSPSDGKHYTLFLRAHEFWREAYDGPRLDREAAISDYGADAAFSISEFERNLLRRQGPGRTPTGYLPGAETIYVSGAGDRMLSEMLRAPLDELRAQETKGRSIADAAQIVNELRLVKDDQEITLMRRAAQITAQGHVRAMKAAAPGKYEFEIQQALDSYCLANGAQEMAYPSIVGSGPHSIYLHWEKNDRQTKAGDLVLDDSGAEYAHYASDVTRTYPVSGHFSTEQKAVYEAVLSAQKATMALVRPGMTHDEIENAAARFQIEGLVKLGLLSGDVEKLAADGTYRRFTLHGVSHWVGLDVHDAGPYLIGSASRPLVPGMVLTIEPGIYISANSPDVAAKWWNIGVRIEDTVLVTPTGYECLSCEAPKEVADVEKAVQGK